jgi:hypothetical protein
LRSENKPGLIEGKPSRFACRFDLYKCGQSLGRFLCPTM